MDRETLGFGVSLLTLFVAILQLVHSLDKDR